jgi:hypothetical protein
MFYLLHLHNHQNDNKSNLLFRLDFQLKLLIEFYESISGNFNFSD